MPFNPCIFVLVWVIYHISFTHRSEYIYAYIDVLEFSNPGLIANIWIKTNKSYTFYFGQNLNQVDIQYSEKENTYMNVFFLIWNIIGKKIRETKIEKICESFLKVSLFVYISNCQHVRLFVCQTSWVLIDFYFAVELISGWILSFNVAGFIYLTHSSHQLSELPINHVINRRTSLR